MSDLKRILDQMDPEEALAEISDVVRRFFLLARTDARRRFIANMVGQSGDDKVGSLVHL